MSEGMLPFITEAMVEAGYQKLRNFLAGDERAIKALDMERFGGECMEPRCRKPFEKVVVKNRFADFAWYRPACRCYHVCNRITVHDGNGKPLGHVVDENGKQVGCGKVLVEEGFKTEVNCLSCNPPRQYGEYVKNNTPNEPSQRRRRP